MHRLQSDSFTNYPSCFPHLLLIKEYTKAHESLYRTLNRNPPATKNFKIDNFNLKNLTHLKATDDSGPIDALKKIKATSFKVNMEENGYIIA